MIEGTLVAESLRVGTNLENPKLTVRRISRVRLENTTADQPEIWTLLDFEADEADADELARTFAEALDQPGWYADFRSPRRRSWYSQAVSSVTRAETTLAQPRSEPTAASSPSPRRDSTGPSETVTPSPTPAESSANFRPTDAGQRAPSGGAAPEAGWRSRPGVAGGGRAVIRQLMCDACLPVDVRHMVWEMGAAVRGRWPLTLRTGWVVLRRITWVPPSAGGHPAR
jgi:hypothetical protein